MFVFMLVFYLCFSICVFVVARVCVIVNLIFLTVQIFMHMCVWEGGWVRGGIFMFSMRVYFHSHMCVDVLSVCFSLCKCFFVFSLVMYFSG